MKRLAITLAAAGALVLSACSGAAATGLDQMVYNATYSGQGTLQRAPDITVAALQPINYSMTLSQLGQDFTGTWTAVVVSDQTTYSGSITGRTTSAGADFTLVELSCSGVLYGSFTVSGTDQLTSQLSGSASGRDCAAGPSGNNVRITFTNLARH
ncbi:MAG: hypothetical protein M3R65_07625 [Gemmatimonadota bacterium]|nr:hypothetical protein [Gemmatimonadota bacterium]